MTSFKSHDLCDYREGATVAPLIDNQGRSYPEGDGGAGMPPRNTQNHS